MTAIDGAEPAPLTSGNDAQIRMARSFLGIHPLPCPPQTAVDATVVPDNTRAYMRSSGWALRVAVQALALVPGGSVCAARAPQNPPAAQTPANQPPPTAVPTQNRGRGEASPASTPLPRTATPQSYPEAQIRAGQAVFSAQCGFCHGRDAMGGESGPDLTRSAVVAEDVRGGKLGPIVRNGRPEKGMPA